MRPQREGGQTKFCLNLEKGNGRGKKQKEKIIKKNDEITVTEIEKKKKDC